ncbi:MAG TPA: alpha-amylase family glycosyl hydrolase, partial [Ardenticatenaceae bacterium]|nr:alpha-amylase family glycosyl hydrolase [Ardenticatenaceae bacterium]
MSPSDSAVPATVPIALRGSDADVWAWEKQVTGTCDCGQEDCAAIYVQSPRGRVEAQRDGGSFSAVVPLVAGENELVAVCQHPDGSLSTSNLLNFKGSLRDRPKAWIGLSIEDGAIVLDGSESTPSEGSGAAIVDYTWSARADNPGPLAVRADGGAEEQPLDGEVGGARLVVAPPTVDGEYYVTLRVVDAEGREDVSTTYFVVEGGEARIPDYATENTAWVEQAIVYGVIVRLFGNEGFRDITARLDYLRDLGINALWLSPVNLSPRGDYGYAVTGYFELNPIYGTKDDFREMVQAAHTRGIRVLMDFVPNHSSAQHPYYRDAEENGRESPYYDFYDRDENGEVTHYFNWEHLPNLNYDNPEVRRFMLAAFSYWVREFDVDGFRVDVAWGIRERRPDFWPEWRRELKRIKPDLLLLAEAGARDDYYFDNGYDAAYDWDAQLGHWAWTR